MIRFENVGLRYGMGPEVLRDLSFQVEPKSFQFLTGASGAGKTTLIRLFFLSLKPTRGLITVFDRDASMLTRHELPRLAHGEARLPAKGRDLQLMGQLGVSHRP